MIDAGALFVFAAAAAALLLTPGPAVLYIVARSIDQGRRAGLVSVAGISLGTLVHVVAAALGVSALLAASALAFGILKYAGAVYLIWLGVRQLRGGRGGPDGDHGRPPQPLRRVFGEGILVNVLNPKTALFFFAFLPQFVQPALDSPGMQVLLFGVLFVAMGLVSDGLYALFAGTFGEWLRGNARFLVWQRRFSAAVYITLGLATAVSGGRSK